MTQQHIEQIEASEWYISCIFPIRLHKLWRVNIRKDPSDFLYAEGYTLEEALSNTITTMETGELFHLSPQYESPPYTPGKQISSVGDNLLELFK